MSRLLMLLFCLPLLAGCDNSPFGFVKIGDITSQPASYEGKEVKVRGEVTDVAKIPFIETMIYTLRDDTGEITVFTFDNLPQVHQRLAITGKVQSAAIIGGEAFGVRLKESRRLPGFLAGG